MALDWALPATQTNEDRRLYAQVERAVAEIIAAHGEGDIDLCVHPELVALVRILYPALTPAAGGMLQGLAASSLP